jgi:hypothetical protein
MKKHIAAKRLSPAILGLTMALLLLVSASGAAGEAETAGIRHKELVFAGADLGGGSSLGVRTTHDGLTSSGSYTSPPITAPLPFSFVGPVWKIDVPDGASYALSIRAGVDAANWGNWIPVEAETDWKMDEEDRTIGELILVPQATGLANTVQFRLELSAAPDGKTPLLRQIRFAFIDPGTTRETSVVRSADNYPKPDVVSRTEWGCPDGSQSPDWLPEYQPVTHIVIHHTVNSNDDGVDFAAIVRAIWSYHTNTLGWGDIGYNYLVDRNGVLYEGRAGGDDVIGGHAYPANHGTMGLSFIGTYTSAPVPQSMLDSAAELIAWKAEQKGIDPHGSGWIYAQDDYADRWKPTISGHRDVGEWYTTCPGDVLLNHLPMLRDEVASLLDAYRYTFVDDYTGDPKLELHGTDYWWHGPDECGYDGHAYYTFSMTDPDASTNAGTWRPNLPESGSYRVAAYVPWCINGTADSSGVYYTIHHALGETEVAVSQATGAGGWVDLGVYDFGAGTEGYVYLSDVADDYMKTIWFDTVRWQREGGTAVGTMPPNNAQPADQSWKTTGTVAFRWSTSTSEGVTEYVISLSTNPDLSAPFHTATTDYAEVDWEYDFSQDYEAVYWGVIAMGPNGASLPSTPWRLGIDTIAPTAAINAVYTYPDGHYSVHWGGEDLTSGIATYDVEISEGDADSWVPWLTDTSATGASVPEPVTEPSWFRVRATDVAGHTGAFDDGDLRTTDALLLDKQAFLPAVFRDWPYIP